MGGLMQSARAAQAAAGGQTMPGGNVPKPSEEEPAPEPVKTATPRQSASNETKGSAPASAESPAWPARNEVRVPTSSNNDFELRDDQMFENARPRKDLPPPFNQASDALRAQQKGPSKSPLSTSDIFDLQNRQIPGDLRPRQGLPEPFDDTVKALKAQGGLVRYPSYRSLPNSSPAFPGDDQIKWSHAYDQSYGDPSGAYFKPDAKIRTLSVQDVKADDEEKDETKALFKNGGKPIDGPLTVIDEDTSNQIHKAWLGSQRSAVATLGFDLARTIVGLRENANAEEAGFKIRLHPSTEKLYREKFDQMWFDAKYPAALVHESIHRGLEVLEINGRLPKGIDLDKKIPHNGFLITKNELLTRALMMRLFKDTEMTQHGRTRESVFKGDKSEWASQFQLAQKYIKPGELDAIEKAARRLIFEQRPGGPR